MEFHRKSLTSNSISELQQFKSMSSVKKGNNAGTGLKINLSSDAQGASGAMTRQSQALSSVKNLNYIF